MRLRDAFNILLENRSETAEGAAVKEKIEEAISTIDLEMGQLESAARVLYEFGLDDLKKRIPVGPKEPAQRLLKALHCVQDARLLTARGYEIEGSVG